MATFVFLLGIFSLVISLSTVNGQGPPQIGISIRANPTTIVEGFNATQVLQLECRYNGNEALSSLTIGRFSDFGQQIQLAVLNRQDGRPTGTQALENDYEVYGGLPSPDNLNFLALTIEKPTSQNAGLYFCEGKRINSFFRFGRSDLFGTVRVGLKPLDTEDLVNRILELTQCVEDLKARSQDGGDMGPPPPPDMMETMDTDGMGDDMTDEDRIELEELIQNLTNKVEELQQLNEDLLSRLEATGASVSESEADIAAVDCELIRIKQLAAVFLELHHTKSEPFEGREYHFAELHGVSFVKVQDLCINLGGYLLEIDSDEELEFVKTFLSDKMTPMQYVMIGAQKSEAEEGKFVNRFSQTEANVTSFFYARPDNRNGKEDCVALVKNFAGVPGIYMDDIPCDYIPYRDFEWQHSYICEVPIVPPRICTHQPAQP